MVRFQITHRNILTSVLLPCQLFCSPETYIYILYIYIFLTKLLEMGNALKMMIDF